MDTLLKKQFQSRTLCLVNSQDFNLLTTQLNIFLIRLPISLFLLFTLLVIPIATSSKTAANHHSNLEYFVEFQPGNYQQQLPNALDRLIENIEQTAQVHLITLTGHSQSRTSFASKQLALSRAEIIKKALVRKGISVDRIETDGEHENFKDEGELLHGVWVTSTPPKSASDTSEVNTDDYNQLSNNLRVIGFIEFAPSKYDREIPDETDKILPKLALLPSATNIKIIGISQSKTFLATEKLALQRAQVIADSLIAEGIASERIQLDTEVTNLIENNYLTHGVHIYAEIEPSSTKETASTNHLSLKAPSQNKPISTQQTLENVLKRLNQTTKPQSQSKPKKIKPSPTAKRSCTEFEIRKGSLKKNIQREIADCGYQMGQWSFGTDEEYIDWLIPIAYKVNVEKGIFGILKIIEKNYQVRAHVHQLDQSIDFLASIKRDKGQ